MPTKKKDACPYVDRECLRERCHGWVTVWKEDQTTGERKPEQRCGETYKLHVMNELLQAMRHTEAHADKFVERLQVASDKLVGLTQSVDRAVSLSEVEEGPYSVRVVSPRMLAGCVYEARNRSGDRSASAAVDTWCRTHGWDCPNNKERSTEEH